MNSKDSKYHVGDKVRIVGVSRCVYGQNHNMRALIGEVRTIRRVSWDGSNGCYFYYIENDNHGTWIWDDSCFELETQVELPEFDTSGADLLMLIS